MPRCTEYTEDWIDEQRNRSGVENRSNGIGQHLYVSATDDDIMTGGCQQSHTVR